MTRLRVCVIGGGLAGLSAAITCADAGADVVLLESRGRLGGATFSIHRDGLALDNGQHLVLRCCIAYLGFLDRIGTRHLVRFQRRLQVPVRTPGGPDAAIWRTAGPPPLHLAASLARYPHLSRTEKAAAVVAMRALKRLDPADRRLDALSFGDWLRSQHQSARAIAALWGLISVPTINLRPDDTSLAVAATVFRTGLLDSADAADIGLPEVPLTALHVEPAIDALRRAGATIRRSARVSSVRGTAGGVAIGTRAGTVEADAAIVAVPHDVAGGLLPPGTVPGQDALVQLGHSPIVNLHIALDRTVMTERFIAGYRTPLQWIFDRTRASGVRRGQCLAVTLSAADEWIGVPSGELRDRLLPELGKLFPAARDASVEAFVVTREPHATFRATPGSGRLRPGEITDTPGVFLAGSWTDTGWPATMEGAVRSGLRAARRALAPTPARNKAHVSVAPHSDGSEPVGTKREDIRL
ncbi:MAG: hydroxysqualene dehydroxylase HpnE [Mycobacteriales bacterium]